MNSVHYRIEPVDSWFFRDALPFDVVGGNSLSSLFPPSARTVFSALHSARQEQASRADGQQGIGPYLIQRHGSSDWDRLYPLPLNLLARRSPEDDTLSFKRLQVGLNDKPVRCDLGCVLMPSLPRAAPEDRGYKPLEQAWVTSQGMSRILAGSAPDSGEVLTLASLLSSENRVGLARHGVSRTAREGLLYETRHYRLHPDLQIALGATLLDSDWPGGMIRFGGEGRMAEIATVSGLQQCQVGESGGKSQGLILYLLTPARLGRFDVPWSDEPFDYAAHRQRNRSQARHVPPGLKSVDLDGRRVWQGVMPFHKNGEHGEIRLTVHSAVTGKAVREGGWKISQNEARAVRSLIPAGSLWYCTLDEPGLSNKDAAKRLHGAQIGEEWQLGRGELAVGVWLV